MINQVIVIGQGGHSKVVHDVMKSTPYLEVAGFLDDKYDEIGIRGKYVYGPVSAAIQLKQSYKNVYFFIAIGSNRVRETIVKKLKLPSESYLSLAHQSAVISPSAKIGHGTVIMANVVINADSQIGSHSIINTSSVVEHDSVVEDFVHLSPSVTLCGSTVVRNGALVGAGSSVIPGIQIGEWSVIGAGSSVINDISPYCTAVGVPAREKANQRMQRN